MKATQTLVTEIKARIDALQVWFAVKPCGWKKWATPQQLQQWDDREREEQYLLERLEMLEAK